MFTITQEFLPICYVLGSVVGRKSDTIMHRQKLETILQPKRTERVVRTKSAFGAITAITIIEMLVRSSSEWRGFCYFLEYFTQFVLTCVLSSVGHKLNIAKFGRRVDSFHRNKNNLNASENPACNKSQHRLPAKAGQWHNFASENVITWHLVMKWWRNSRNVLFVWN